MKIKTLLCILAMAMAVVGMTSCSASRDASKNNSGSKRQSTLKDDRVEKPTGSLAKACKKLGVSNSNVKNAQLYIESASWIGTSYKYGGKSRSGVDCSGLTGLIYKNVYGKNLSRSSAGILQDNCSKIKKSSLKEGDLVFFRTDGKKSSTPNHVGIYLKEDKFIHASTSKGVIVSSMTQDYYVRTFITGGKVK